MIPMMKTSISNNRISRLNKVKQFKKQKRLLKLISYETRWNIEHEGKHKQEQILKQFFKKIKTCKATNKDSAIHK